jgi:hypothetical protein
MNAQPKAPRWLLAGLVLLSGFYFMENPVIRFGASRAGAPLTGQEQIANLLVAATVATLLFIAFRAISAATNRK